MQYFIKNQYSLSLQSNKKLYRNTLNICIIKLNYKFKCLTIKALIE